jgi:prepilin signal peptidase PulO-like enzyme (type II secretory pathway)
MSDREFDWIFIALLPPIGALISWALNYALMSAVMGGRPLTPLQKSINLYLFFGILGIGYLMGFTKLLGLSPQTLWVTLPSLAIVLATVAWWRYRALSSGPKTPATPRG